MADLLTRTDALSPRSLYPAVGWQPQVGRGGVSPAVGQGRPCRRPLDSRRHTLAQRPAHLLLASALLPSGRWWCWRRAPTISSTRRS